MTTDAGLQSSEIDQSLMWRQTEARLAETVDLRERSNLETVIRHMHAEASGDLDGLMATLIADPSYAQWQQGVDIGPKGHDAVRSFYTGFIASGSAVFEFDIDRLVVDRGCVVTEGTMRMVVPGEVAARMGAATEDPANEVYIHASRLLLLWPFDADGRLVGEDSYSSSGPDAFRRLQSHELPQAYRDLIGGQQ